MIVNISRKRLGHMPVAAPMPLALLARCSHTAKILAPPILFGPSAIIILAIVVCVRSCVRGNPIDFCRTVTFSSVSIVEVCNLLERSKDQGVCEVVYRTI